MVIAIIAVLAGLLLPALSRAKSKALRIRCTSNQHQIGLGFQMYADDNRESYPVHEGPADVGGKQGVLALNGGLTPATNRPLNRAQLSCLCGPGEDPLAPGFSPVTSAGQPTTVSTVSAPPSSDATPKPLKRLGRRHSQSPG